MYVGTWEPESFFLFEIRNLGALSLYAGSVRRKHTRPAAQAHLARDRGARAGETAPLTRKERDIGEPFSDRISSLDTTTMLGHANRARLATILAQQALPLI